MTFATQFEQALTIKSASNHDILPSPQYFAGDFYELPPSLDSTVPVILSGGTIRISTPCALHFAPLDCRMLLHTIEGDGTLEIHGGSQALPTGSLLYLNCQDTSFTLSPSRLSWRYACFLCRGESLAAYESLVAFQTFAIRNLDEYSPLLRDLKLLSSGSHSASLSNKLKDASLLTSIVAGLFIDAFALKEDKEKSAPYLKELKRLFDNSFMEPFRLDDLADHYHMSKYRICHEFSAAFGAPPLKYLNRKRVETAAALLITTDQKVHEIALTVGYENTNHFISLFKKEYGTTPPAYRQAHQN